MNAAYTFCRRTFAHRFETFLRYLDVQLASEARKSVLDALLEFIPDEGSPHCCHPMIVLKQKIVKDFMLKNDASSLWKNMEAVAVRLDLTNALDALLLKWTFPRLDANVSVQSTHLIKAPFSVHPDTNKICVPIKIEEIDEFLVESAPTLDSLASDATCLGPYLIYFANFTYSL